MKTHKVRDTGIIVLPDQFTTWCGLSDLNNPSEELMENLVYEYEECSTVE